jgi:ABC-2 type transport system ATP-binding protein
MAPTIEARGLEKSYGRTRALDRLDLVAEPGQVVAVLGPNGAGKTTFVRAVATLLRLDGGTLRVAGHDVRREPQEVRRVIGLAGQFAAVEPAMTARENLEMVARLFGHERRAAKAAAAAVLERLGLVDAGDPPVRTYSGGMRRKLDLGASLVGDPRLLLLDEPTTGLDPRSRIELWDAIRALVEADTDVLLTTQYMESRVHRRGRVRGRLPRPRHRARRDRGVRPGGVVRVRVRVALHRGRVARRRSAGSPGRRAAGVPACVRLERVRAGGLDARLAAGLRRAPAAHLHGRRGPGAHAGTGRRGGARAPGVVLCDAGAAVGGGDNRGGGSARRRQVPARLITSVVDFRLARSTH